VKWGIVDVRAGAILFKPGWINWNAISHQEEGKSIAHQAEADIRSGCTLRNIGSNISTLDNTHHTLSGLYEFATASLWSKIGHFAF
jgi:hypothetical protein